MGNYRILKDIMWKGKPAKELGLYSDNTGMEMRVIVHNHGMFYETMELGKKVMVLQIRNPKTGEAADHAITDCGIFDGVLASIVMVESDNDCFMLSTGEYRKQMAMNKIRDMKSKLDLLTRKVLFKLNRR